MDMVLSDRYHQAVAWCEQNGVDKRLAVDEHGLAIRLMRLRKPVVKLVGSVDQHSLELIAERFGRIV